MLKTRFTEAFGVEFPIVPGDDVPGLVLIPAAADRLDIPIIASGGFADARGLVGALDAGRGRGQHGHSSMGTAQSPIHETIKRRIGEADERQTDPIVRSFRNTARVGPCQGLIHDIPTCAELIERIVTDAEAIIAERWAGIAGLPGAALAG